MVEEAIWYSFKGIEEVLASGIIPFPYTSNIQLFTQLSEEMRILILTGLRCDTFWQHPH